VKLESPVKTPQVALQSFHIGLHGFIKIASDIGVPRQKIQSAQSNVRTEINDHPRLQINSVVLTTKDFVQRQHVVMRMECRMKHAHRRANSEFDGIIALAEQIPIDSIGKCGVPAQHIE